MTVDVPAAQDDTAECQSQIQALLVELKNLFRYILHKSISKFELEIFGFQVGQNIFTFGGFGPSAQCFKPQRV